MSEEGSKLHVLVEGIESINTYNIPSLIADGQLAFAENMVPDNGGHSIRNGSKVFKNNTQWGENAVIAGESYQLDDGDAEVVVILENGEVYYATVDAISTVSGSTVDPTVVMNPTLSWTLLTTLTITDKNDVYIKVLNNLVYISDGSDMLKYYGNSHTLQVAPDPAGFEITMTVGSAVAATIDATYEDAADTSRTFNIELTKTGGVGTTLTLRQITGTTRPASTGTLTKLTGTGDASIAWTAVAYSESFDALGTRDSRLLLLSSIGDTIISHPNRGYDFTSDQAERVPYGKTDGLRVTNATDFKRGTILSLSRQKIRKAATAILKGYRKYDTTTPERTDGLFNIDRESNMVALLGRSGLEVGNGFIGLTRNGFINFAALQSSSEFGLTDADYVSNDIKNIINRIDWSLADDIRSCIDETNQRYWCAVPITGAGGNSLVCVYDFASSREAVRNLGASHKWSFFTFNYGNVTISSLFTLFGQPCLGLSDGTVIMAEIANYYYDNGAAYPSSVLTKSHNFGIRTHKKSWTSGMVELIADPALGDSAQFKAYVIYDQNYQSTNWNKEDNSTKYVHPQSIDNNDNWTVEEVDLWSLNPFDTWSNSVSNRYALMLSNAPDFREVALFIQNNQGGYKWGIYGYEMWAKLGAQYYDARAKNIIKTVNQN